MLHTWLGLTMRHFELFDVYSERAWDYQSLQKVFIPIFRRTTELCKTFYCCFWDYHINLTGKNVNCWFVSFFSKNQNSGQSTHLSIHITAVLKGKSDKDFKKAVPICSNPSYNLQFLKVWAVLRWNLPKKTSLSIFAIFSKIQNPGQITHSSIDMTAVLIEKSDKDI